MKWLGVSLVLAAGCASGPEYLPGPPVTVREPAYNGTVAATPRPTSTPPGQLSYCPIDPAPPEPPRPARSRWSDFLGFRWGDADRLAYRDRGLDRLMNNTLSSSGPSGYNTARGLIELEIETWPYNQATLGPVDSREWLFPTPIGD